MLLPYSCITSTCHGFVTICSAANHFLGTILFFQVMRSHSAWLRKGR